MKVTVYRRRFSKQWRWRLRAANGRILADGGESYTNKDDAVAALKRIFSPENPMFLEIDDRGVVEQQEPLRRAP